MGQVKPWAVGEALSIRSCFKDVPILYSSKEKTVEHYRSKNTLIYFEK